MADQSVPPSPVVAGLMCRCPRCGRGPLFKGLLTLDVNPACSDCGLDFRFIDSGDGPAVFAIFILGAAVMGLALFVEFTFSPPLWVHVLLWVPFTLGLALILMRVLKSLLSAQQYKHKAGEIDAHAVSAEKVPGSRDEA